MKALEWGEVVPDGEGLTPEELAEMEEGCRLWEYELAEALKSGDQAWIDEVYEMGK